MLLIALVLGVAFTLFRYQRTVLSWNRIRYALEQPAPELTKKLAPNGKSYSRYYAELFAITNDKELSVFMNGTDRSLAIQSAWEKIRRTIPDEPGKELYKPDQRVLEKFLEFLNSRTAVEIPDWWRNVVLDCSIKQRGGTFLPGPPGAAPHHLPLDKVACPKDATVEKHKEYLVYRNGNNVIPIPEDSLAHFKNNWWGYINVCFHNHHAYMSVRDYRGGFVGFLCIDQTAGYVQWKNGFKELPGSEIYVSGMKPNANASNITMIPIDENRIAKFSSSRLGFRYEEFDAHDGATLVSFYSKY